ncbi:TraB/GumN family protein [Polluticoccus soli]|uniref:TraB/GumN family protein n=1 Tax=Polluticoccus soli TaxID=3034150 RepID=UPI0023E0DE22|nr:TraB/GumN family protein [Flavipsychrobacter sp. JY13-12]
MFACAFICLPAFSKQQKGKSLLWRITGKDMKKPSYLFGTIHLVCPEDYFWTTTMESTLNSAEVVCFEMDLDAPDIFLEVAKGMINNEEKKLKDYFSDEDFAALKKYLTDSVGVDIAVFQMMKPVAIQTMLAERALGCPTPVSYEANIMQIAQKENKEILGLETPREQLDLFDNLPAEDVAKDLLDMIHGKDDSKNQYIKLVTAYKKQDLVALHRLIMESSKKDMDLGGFLDVRNEKWVPRMVERMDQQSVFFAVGAGHLWGDNGVIALLRKSGYTVEPMK